MEIAKNSTKLDKKTLSSFQTMEIFKRSWLIGLCALVLIALSFELVNGNVQLDSLVTLIIGAAIWPLYVILLKILYARQNKKLGTTFIDYVFTDEKISIEGNGPTGIEKMDVPYVNILKISQNRKFLFLSINKESALVVDKNNFSVGSAEKVVNLIKFRLSPKKPQ